MTNFIQSVNERTNLAGTNKLEVLLFSLGKDELTGREEVYGINVFKVREVLQAPEITRVPDMPAAVEGMTSLRGVMIPVVNLSKFCNLNISNDPKILIVTEYNKNMQGFLVHSVDNILRLQWSDIKVPPPMLAGQHGGLITAITEIKDNNIAMIMDVEKILAETSDLNQDDFFLQENPNNLSGQGFTVLFADDSTVARSQIKQTLESMGVSFISTITGAEAWNKLTEIADRAETLGKPVSEYIQLVLTDVEMPEMDGYVLTKNIKSDSRFNGIPVIMHSSLSASVNKALGNGVGADEYIPKFKPEDLSNKLAEMLTKNKQK